LPLDTNCVGLQEIEAGSFIFKDLIHVNVNRTAIISRLDCVSFAHVTLVGGNQALLLSQIAGILPEAIGNFVNLQRLVRFFFMSSKVAGREYLKCRVVFEAFIVTLRFFVCLQLTHM
jgi:hypothetical protein